MQCNFGAISSPLDFLASLSLIKNTWSSLSNSYLLHLWANPRFDQSSDLIGIFTSLNQLVGLIRVLSFISYFNLLSFKTAGLPHVCIAREHRGEGLLNGLFNECYLTLMSLNHF